MKRSKADYDAAIIVLVQLRERFPDVISHLNADRRQPLKIGIDNDIRALLPEIDPKTVGYALALYTGHIVYLRSLVEGASRIDLTGKEVDTVTANAASHAKDRLEKALERAKKGAKAKEVAKEVTRKERLALGIASLRASAHNRRASL
jgi:ProP effector